MSLFFKNIVVSIQLHRRISNLSTSEGIQINNNLIGQFLKLDFWLVHWLRQVDMLFLVTFWNTLDIFHAIHRRLFILFNWLNSIAVDQSKFWYLKIIPEVEDCNTQKCQCLQNLEENKSYLLTQEVQTGVKVLGV